MTQAEPSTSLVTVGQIADLAEVQSSAVSNWRKRFGDFPQAVQAAPGGRDLFELGAVERWMQNHGRLGRKGGGKRLIFAAADLLRGAVSVGPMVEIMGAALALAAVVRRSGRPRQEALSVEALRAGLSTFDPGLEEVFRPLRDIARPTADDLLGLVAEIEEEDLLECFDWVLSRLQHPVDTHGSGDTLTALLRALVGEAEGVVYDPTAGSGGFLQALWSPRQRPELLGQELSDSAWRLARQRFLIQDIPVLLARGDSLVKDAWPELRAEVVVCDPPYQAKKPLPDSSAGDPRWISGRPPARSDFAWLQHAAYHLSEHGRGYVFLPHGSLFRRGKETELRRELLAEGFVEAVVSLPPGSAHRTGIPLALWVLRPAASGSDCESVLMVDPAAIASAPRAALTGPVMARVAEVLRNWRLHREVSEENRALAAAVPVLGLMRGDANLTPARWLTSDLTAADRGRRETELNQRKKGLQDARAALATVPAVPDLPVGRGPGQWTRVEQLTADQIAQIVRGIRVRPEHQSPSGLPVIRNADVSTMGPKDSEPFLIDPAELTPRPEPTQPGDILVAATNERLTAMVDRRGGHILVAPLQALRLADGSIDPELVAAFLESPRNRRFLTGAVRSQVNLRDLEVPILPLDEATRLATALARLHEQEQLANRVVGESQRLREIVVDLASSSFAVEDSDG